jgi:hypothetical protein
MFEMINGLFPKFLGDPAEQEIWVQFENYVPANKERDQVLRNMAEFILNPNYNHRKGVPEIIDILSKHVKFDKFHSDLTYFVEKLSVERKKISEFLKNDLEHYTKDVLKEFGYHSDAKFHYYENLYNKFTIEVNGDKMIIEPNGYDSPLVSFLNYYEKFYNKFKVEVNGNKMIIEPNGYDSLVSFLDFYKYHILYNIVNLHEEQKKVDVYVQKEMVEIIRSRFEMTFNRPGTDLDIKLQPEDRIINVSNLQIRYELDEFHTNFESIILFILKCANRECLDFANKK